MKITKLVHSCVVFENDGKKFLVDPGSYGWQSGLVKDEHLTSIDFVAVTHIHPDHLDKAFAEAISKKSPNAKWYGPAQVISQLKEWGISGDTTSDSEDVQFIASQHADLLPWFPEQPDHTSYLLFGKVLVGGDCHTLTDGLNAEIFGAAVNGGPWGAVLGFARMIEGMVNRPQKVIPLHDWHWNEKAREAIYSQLPGVLSQFNVEFVPLQNGVTQEI